MTAGIAREIKNPLNFVNNFSAVSVEPLPIPKGVSAMPMIEWNDVAAPQKPPEKERLLLITAADEFDAQLKGQSEVEVGYWTGNHFRFMRDDSIAHRVARWAILAPCLPNDVRLKRFDPDMRG